MSTVNRQPSTVNRRPSTVSRPKFSISCSRVSFLIPVRVGSFFSVYRVFRVFRVFRGGIANYLNYPNNPAVAVLRRIIRYASIKKRAQHCARFFTSNLYSIYPYLRSSRLLLRQFSSTLTCSCRKTFLPMNFSSSTRAAVPTFLSISPLRPMMIPFCESRAT